jgi:hypothetical protein
MASPSVNFCRKRAPCRALSVVLRVDGHTFRVWTEFTVSTGKRSEHPRGMLSVTRMQELQAEQAYGILECKFLPKNARRTILGASTRTYHLQAIKLRSHLHAVCERVWRVNGHHMHSVRVYRERERKKEKETHIHKHKHRHSHTDRECTHFH